MAYRAKNVVRVDLKGADELSDNLLRISQFFRGTVLKKAVNKAAQVLVPPLRRATPRSTAQTKSRASRAKFPSGQMRKSTGKIYRKYKSGAVQAVYVGHRWPKGAAAHLVAQGTKDRTVLNKSRSPKVPLKKPRFAGRVKATNFFKNAVDPLRSRVMETMKSELAKGLEEAAMKKLVKSTAAAAALHGTQSI